MPRRITLNSLDRSRIKWSKGTLREHIITLWAARGRRAEVLPFTIYNVRLVAALKRSMTREGWRVYVVTQLKSKTIAVFIRQSYRGARPKR